MSSPQAQELIEQAANSADKLIIQLQRDRVGLPEEGQNAVDAVIAAARRIISEVKDNEQRRIS
jgi:hypothetical protein